MDKATVDITPPTTSSLLIGVLALQGAFEEHQKCFEAIGCRTVQVRTPNELEGLDAIVLPGGESTAMGLIGTSTTTTTTSSSASAFTNEQQSQIMQSNQQQKQQQQEQPQRQSSNISNTSGSSSYTSSNGNMWDSLREFSKFKPVWGTCAGMILLAEKCIGTSAVIQDGQALIGGMPITVCRNYFGSQISSFEMPVPLPPQTRNNTNASEVVLASSSSSSSSTFPGVFIRAPAILTAEPSVEVLGRVVATPCRQAAVTLQELERKIAAGEDVVKMGVADALDRNGRTIQYKVVLESSSSVNSDNDNNIQEEKKSGMYDNDEMILSLPGASDGTNARNVICAVQKGHVLCTAFHPELTDDYRWHEYFVQIVHESKCGAVKQQQ